MLLTVMTAVWFKYLVLGIGGQGQAVAGVVGFL